VAKQGSALGVKAIAAMADTHFAFMTLAAALIT
jgi:hypothetical protein